MDSRMNKTLKLDPQLGCRKNPINKDHSTSIEYSNRVTLCDLLRGGLKTPHNKLGSSHRTTTNTVLTILTTQRTALGKEAFAEGMALGKDRPTANQIFAEGRGPRQIRAMTEALGKEGSFAEGPSNSPRQRFFGKKS